MTRERGNGESREWGVVPPEVSQDPDAEVTSSEVGSTVEGTTPYSLLPQEGTTPYSLLPVLFLLALLVSLATPLPAGAQTPSAYLSSSHWSSPHIEFFIRSGVIDDPDPLTRPLKKGDVVAALQNADTTRASAAVRQTVREILSALGEETRRSALRGDFYLGASTATHGRREPLREGGDDYLGLLAGAHLAANFGPIVLSTHPYFDQRLKHDPDYTGEKDRRIIPRFEDAYISVQFKYGEAFFGAADRNWGPPGLPGVIVSSEPYSYDHLFLRLGTRNLFVETRSAELDPMDDGAGNEARRFWATHRVVARPWPWLVASFGHASLWSGAGRNAEPWWLNPLKLTTLVRLDEGDAGGEVNSLYSGSISLRLRSGTVLHATFMLDDLASLVGTSGAPDRIAGTALLDVPLSPGLAARFSYELVSSLAYRTPAGADQTVIRQGIGLGQNYSDFTRATISLSVMPTALVNLTPEVSLLHQGEGNIRDPWPSAPTADHPFLFEGVVERTWRLGLRASASIAHGVHADGHFAVHLVSNSGHVEEVSRTPVVAGLRLSYRIGGSRPLP